MAWLRASGGGVQPSKTMYIIKDGALQGNCTLANTKYFPSSQSSAGSDYNTSATITQSGNYLRLTKTTSTGAYASDCVQYYINKSGWESIGWSLQAGDIIHVEAQFTPYPEGAYSSQTARFGLWNGSTSSNLSVSTTLYKSSAKTDHQLAVTSGNQNCHLWLIEFVSAGPIGSTFYFDVYNIWVERN